MPKVKRGTPVSSQKKKSKGMAVQDGGIIGAVPAKAGIMRLRVIPVKDSIMKFDAVPVVDGIVKTAVTRRKSAEKLIASMNLDEMLEASKIVEMELKGEKIPKIKSPKVQKYVGTILGTDKRDMKKSIVRKMQNDLSIEIIERNKQTTNVVEATRLYHALMDEE